MENCNTSSLKVFVPSSSNKWDAQKVRHLYRRLCFGVSPAMIDIVITKPPEEVVDLIVDEAKNLAPTAAPIWAGKGKKQLESEGFDFDETNNANKRELYAQCVSDLLNNGLRDNLTLFWHNHFVTQHTVYNCSSYMFEYYNTLQVYALGNFKDFVRKIGLTNAMLRYLNGKSNKKNKPNENYARELYELFTLGENNGYTQKDIEETAKALTGYNKGAFCEPIEFDIRTFNDSDKTIFGKTGPWDYNDAIDILFEEKGPLIAEFIVTKLYRYFISPEINTTIIKELAKDFEVDFEIEPILRKLFKSEHFFDDKSISTLIKSPYDLNMHFYKTTGFPLEQDNMLNLYWQTGNLGQSYFQPVDVAGWQGDYDWINTSTITGRWDTITNYVWRVWNRKAGNREKLRDFAKEASNNSADINVVVPAIIDTLLPKGLNTPENYQDAIDVFKTDSIPCDYFTDGTWSLDFDRVPFQVVLLLNYIIRLPEFQLK